MLPAAVPSARRCIGHRRSPLPRSGRNRQGAAASLPRIGRGWLPLHVQQACACTRSYPGKRRGWLRGGRAAPGQRRHPGVRCASTRVAALAGAWRQQRVRPACHPVRAPRGRARQRPASANAPVLSRRAVRLNRQVAGAAGCYGAMRMASRMQSTESTDTKTSTARSARGSLACSRVSTAAKAPGYNDTMISWPPALESGLRAATCGSGC